MRIAILGNAGAGKSSLARALACDGVAVLDLDTIVWEANSSATPRAQGAIIDDLERFCSCHAEWIVEGCYGDLIEAVLPWRPELIFLNPGEDICRRRCRERAWEPHKYSSKSAQDADLPNLLDWVSAYYRCGGPLSYAAHRALFEQYDGPKREIREV